MYIASRDQSLYLLDLGGGQPRWRARFSGPLEEPPFVTPDTAYQYCAAEGLAAIETAVGAEVDNRFRWRLPQGRQALTTDAKFVYVLSQGGELLAVRIKDGAVQSSAPACGLSLGIPARDATILLVSPDGRVFCARPDTVPFLRQEDVLKALRPGGVPEEAATTSQPTTRPANAMEEFLRSRRTPTATGGKSGVSKGLERKAGESNP